MVAQQLSSRSLNAFSEGASATESDSLLHGHSNCECCLPSGELESRLPDLELMPTKVVHSWLIEELFQMQVQVTVE